jgi:putative ABC transport system permease protein
MAAVQQQLPTPDGFKWVRLATREPADLVNFGRIGSLPLIVGGTLAFFACVVLVHTMVTSVARRRHDMATLRALGFVRAQVRWTVVAQELVIVAIALVIGTLGGLIIGRVTWKSFADDLGIVAPSVVPVGLLLGAAAASVVIGAITAMIPAYLASRIKPATALRAE